MILNINLKFQYLDTNYFILYKKTKMSKQILYTILSILGSYGNICLFIK